MTRYLPIDVTTEGVEMRALLAWVTDPGVQALRFA